MIIKCGVCGENLDVDDSLPCGTKIGSPFCGADSIVQKPARIELPADLDRRKRTMRPAYKSKNEGEKPRLHVRRTSAISQQSNVGAARIMERIECKNIKEKELQSRAFAEQRNFAIAIILLILIVAGASALYWGKLQNRRSAPGTSIGGARAEELERSKLTAEQDAEREKRRNEYEAERARRRAEAEAEREKRRLAREKELKERKEKVEAEKANRERIADVERKFKSASIVFASDFAADKSPIKRDGTFYAIGLEYISDQKVYEAMVEDGAVVAVRAFSTRGGPTDVEVETFTDNIMKNRLLVLGEDGVIWICGTGKSFWTEKVSIASDDIMPAKIELGELFAILSRWGQLPNLKYRLTLKPSKNGELVKSGKEMPLGIIEYAAAISPDRIRDAILKQLQEKRESSVNVKPPQPRKFTPTVVFYDGDVIRKEMRVTKVPRTFKHLGTKINGTVKNTTYMQAEEQWLRLKEEAERQERRKEAVMRENAQLMREYEEKIREILSRGISGEQIEAETQKYLLLIERSRSRLVK